MEARFVDLFYRLACCALAATLLAPSNSVFAQPLPFFSGAEGYGGTWSGAVPAGGIFSGATVPANTPLVYHVTNLNDSGPGSFRGAFAENSSNKIVVFDVAGTIKLTSGKLDIKNLSNYYIAGQTAPGPVTIYGDMVQLTHSGGKENRNVVLRYLSFRKGDSSNDDSITFAGSGLGTNLILDHVSASWSEDEILSVTNNNTNVTVQYSTIHDALVSNHAYGSLIRPKIDSNVTFHHNLYAHNASRQARFGTYEAETLTADFRNNIVYNFRDRASYAGGSSESEQEFADINYVGNYIIAGPGTGSVPSKFGGTGIAFSVDKNIDARVYQSTNLIDPNGPAPPGTADGTGKYNGTDTGWGMFQVSTPVTDQTLTQMNGTPFATAPVTTQSAVDAYNQVVNYAGNFWWSRDAIDTRVFNNLTNYTGPALGQSAPNAAEQNALTTAPLVTRAAGWDTDNDGMPNAWELAHGLNPNSAADNKLDFDNDGYINVLEYLDEAGAFPAPAPIVFNGTTNNRYAQITNWKTQNFTSADNVVHAGSNWQPSRFDEARINSGTVVVDAVGQHAKVLKVGAAAGQSATLNITGGWIDVASQLVVGADPAATAVVNLSGGTLIAPTIDKGAGGTFNFTGGTLKTNAVNFDLTNNGGTLAPGQSIGQTHIAGDLTLASGTLQIELASALSADSLLVDGDATLGGNLAILTFGGYTPTLGDNWPIIAADNILNQFTSITAGYSVQKQGDMLRLYFGPAPPAFLPGDFNQDGTVDLGDYIVWRKNFGNPYTEDDYVTWKEHFGETMGSATAGASNVAVPEPTAIALLATAMLLSAAYRRQRPTCTNPQ